MVGKLLEEAPAYGENSIRASDLMNSWVPIWKKMRDSLTSVRTKKNSVDDKLNSTSLQRDEAVPGTPVPSSLMIRKPSKVHTEDVRPREHNLLKTSSSGNGTSPKTPPATTQMTRVVDAPKQYLRGRSLLQVDSRGGAAEDRRGTGTASALRQVSDAIDTWRRSQEDEKNIHPLQALKRTRRGISSRTLKRFENIWA